MSTRRDSNGKFVKGTSGNPKGRPRAARADSYPDPSHQVEEIKLDGWGSLVTGFGHMSTDKRMSTTFTADIVDEQQAIELMKGDDIAARLVEKLPKHAMRPGFDAQITLASGDAKDTQEQIEQCWKDLDLRASVLKALLYERAYGGAALMFGAVDGQELNRPLEIDRVRSFDFVTVFEPREIKPLWYYSDPFAKNFRKPSIYQVTPYSPGLGVGGGYSGNMFEIHESRLHAFGGIQVNGDQSRTGWGDSVLSRAWRVLRDFNTSWDALGVIMADFAQTIFKIKDLHKLVAGDDLKTFTNRMRALELGRSVCRAAILDTEEEFERKTTPLGGVADILDRMESRMAAAANMPITELFGRSPAGMNATGEGDRQSWHETVADYRDTDIIPVYEKVSGLILASMGITADSLEIVGRPIKEETGAERAATRKTHAETAQILITAGILYPEEVAESMFGGDTYNPEIVIDWKERERLEAEADKAQAEADMLALKQAEAAANPNPEDPAAQPGEGDAEDPPQGEEPADDAEIEEPE